MKVRVIQVRPSRQMQNLGVVQDGADILNRLARPFDLPAERAEGESVVHRLFSTMESISRVHHFAKGMGLAAPLIGIDRAVAVVQPPEPDTPAIVLLNPRVTDWSADADEQYEGCLSFFDVRGLVPRPLTITVETTTLDGETVSMLFDRGLARLVHHEIDHLDGLLYISRMRAGVQPVPVEEYRQTGRAWAYEA
jgi:peptide deformylase